MVKRIFLFSVFGLLLHQSAKACDACGCSIAGNGIGLLTAYKTNFVGLGWQLARFRSAPGHGLGSEDYFHSIELSVRYHLSDRFKLLLNQPFRINRRLNSDQTSQALSGFSDTRLVASYTFLKDVRLGNQTSLFFELGGGFKAPIGQYNAQIHDSNLPENFNAGNGSWGFIVQPSFLVTHQKIGLVLNGFYQYHTRTPEDYRYGHQLTTQLLFFGEAAISNMVKLIPNAGLNWEQISEDQYANGKSVSGTGGNGTFLSLGFNMKVSNWMAGFSFSHPTSQSYSHGEVEATNRLSAQFSFLF